MTLRRIVELTNHKEYVKMSGELQVKFPGICDPSSAHEEHFFNLMEAQTGRPVFSYWSAHNAELAPTLVHSIDVETGNLVWENDLRREGGASLVMALWHAARSLAESEQTTTVLTPREFEKVANSDRTTLLKVS